MSERIASDVQILQYARTQLVDPAMYSDLPSLTLKFVLPDIPNHLLSDDTLHLLFDVFFDYVLYGLTWRH